MVNQKVIKQVAFTQQIDQFTILREWLQVSFLEEFYRQEGLTKTYFKGGTAIRLLLESDRFSEDLDFTTELSPELIEANLALTTFKLKSEFPDLVAKKLETVQGYSAKLFLPTEFTSQPLTIKLDFSLREPVIEPQTSPIETFLPLRTTVLVDHLSAKEILSEKIRAFLTRERGRDLFDLWFLLSKKIVIDPEMVSRKMAYYQKSFSLPTLKARVENFPERELDSDLRRFLPISQRKIIPQLKRLVSQHLMAS